MINTASPLFQWVPYRLDIADNHPFCRWLYTGSHPFTEPFFDETIQVCKTYQPFPYTPKVSSDIALLPEWAAEMEALSPAALVFHVSRCGSTLFSQLMGLDAAHVVLAEVPFIDQLLRLPFSLPQWQPEAMEHILHAAIALYGQKRTGQEKKLFLKMDSWHLLFYQQLRSLYPRIPFVLLYRSPLEVWLSHRKRRGMQAVPGVLEPALFGWSNQQVAGMGADRYTAGVLEQYFACCLNSCRNDPHALLFNYAQGILPITLAIAEATQTLISGALQEAMVQRTAYHAKYPQQVFAAESPLHNLPQELEAVMALYHLLEQQRATAGHSPIAANA